MTEPLLIDIHNATIWRGSTLVFKHLNLKIAQHERVVILGPNGSGKTTLLKTINRELYPVVADDSWVRILGQETWNVWDLRRQIGIVSADLERRYTPTTTAIEVALSGFYSSIGVHGMLAERISDDQVARATHVLAKLGVEGLHDTQLQSMSTGQQRRCLLARALVHEPATLIFDEPTTGLDLAASFDYLARVRRLGDDGCNIVIVTHHLSDIPPEVERIVVLKQGRIVADGAKADVLNGELLTEVYETPVRIVESGGYYLAYPG